MNRLVCVACLLLSCSLRAADLPPLQTVFVILMENHVWSQIKGNPNAPFLNQVLLPISSYCAQYYNPPGLHPSLPNYIWIEAGTNFGIRNDNDPSSNHQRSTNHLVTLLKNANISWKTYQEDISGLYVPLTSTNRYTPRHDPFVYFDDVTGTNNPKYAYGIAHIRPYSELAADLTNNTVARYNFITPNLCHDTHDSCAPINNPVRQGDNWLAAEVPKILNSPAYKNGGALFITWDEGDNGSDGPIGMIVLSPLAKGGGYFNTVRYTHSSLLRTLQEIFDVHPFLGDAARAGDLSDLFTRVPAAQCIDAMVSADDTCRADASVNHGSFDPDGDPISVTQTPPGPYPIGTNSVTLTVTDSHGAASSCAATVIVLDSQPPFISCPAPISVTNAHTEWTSRVSFAAPNTVDCSALTGPVCRPASGSIFGLGMNPVICSVVDASGNSSQCSFNVNVWPGNQPPVPSIAISPTAIFPGHTNLFILSASDSGAVVSLDGSNSYDPDDRVFSFLWEDGTNVLSTQSITTNLLPLGEHAIRLSLDDGFPLGTNSLTVHVEVISLSAAVGIIAQFVENSGLPAKFARPLQASLINAASSFDSGHLEAATRQLEALQNKIAPRMSRLYPELADQVDSAVQIVLEAAKAVTAESY